MSYIYGLLITSVGLSLQPKAGGLVAPFHGDFLYNYVLYIGVATFAIGCFGTYSSIKYATANEDSTQAAAHNLLRVYCALLLLTTLLNLTLFLLAGKFASEIDDATPADWMRINATIANYCAESLSTAQTDCITYTEFKAAVEHYFAVMMLAGISSLGYLITGFVASMHLQSQTPAEIAEAEAGLRRRAEEFIDILAILPTVKHSGGDNGESGDGNNDDEQASPLGAAYGTGKRKKSRRAQLRESIGNLSPKSSSGESDMQNPLQGIGGMTFETENDTGSGRNSLSPPPMDDGTDEDVPPTKMTSQV